MDLNQNLPSTESSENQDAPTSHPFRKPGFTGPESEVEITIAPNAGACFGVVRAIKLGYQAVDRAKGRPVYSFGQLIHNPRVVNDLKSRGVTTVSSPSQVENGVVVLRSHGIQKEIESDLRKKGATVLDATCPLVKKPQRIAASLAEKGYFLIIVGDEKHPEIQGVLSYYGKPDYLVTYSPDALSKIPSTVEKVGILAQTTIEVGVLDKVIAAAKNRFREVSVHNTICDATSIRQGEAHQLASQADVVIVVGGKNSSNTQKLVKICKELQPNTYHIESTEEILLDWFHAKKKIGVTGGASTPHEDVNKVGEYIAQLIESNREIVS